MLTQEQYTLFTSHNVNCSDENWTTLVNIAEMRLASLLCLEEFPELDDTNQDLALLLANFLCAVMKFQGTPDTIESKSVRNFTINFKSSATNAFEQIYSQYEDIIEKYTQCGIGIHVERNARHCCGYYNNGYFNF
jgi:hypothetical protein